MEYNEVKRIVDLEKRVRELEIKIEGIERGMHNINLSITRGETIGEKDNTYIDNTYVKPIGKPITNPSSKPFV